MSTNRSVSRATKRPSNKPNKPKTSAIKIPKDVEQLVANTTEAVALRLLVAAVAKSLEGGGDAIRQAAQELISGANEHSIAIGIWRSALCLKKGEDWLAECKQLIEDDYIAASYKELDLLRLPS